MGLIVSKHKLSDLEQEVFLEDVNEYFAEKNMRLGDTSRKNANGKSRVDA